MLQQTWGWQPPDPQGEFYYPTTPVKAGSFITRAATGEDDLRAKIYLQVNQPHLQSEQHVSYCWWKKSSTTWDVYNHVNHGIFTRSTGAVFFPSTVSLPNLCFKECKFKWHFIMLTFMINYTTTRQISHPAQVASSVEVIQVKGSSLPNEKYKPWKLFGREICR